MRGPTPRYYFAPGYTWTSLDADIVWVEITEFVLTPRGAGGQRGRSSELDDMRAGTFSFTLKNDDRRFDPMYSAGDYYGQLLPGVPVKVTGTANGVEYPVFRGFINGWPQDYDRSNKLAYVNVGCTDGMAKLATAGTASSVYALEVAADAPKAWWRLSETIGDVMTDSAGDFDGEYPSRLTAASTHSPNAWETRPALEFDGSTQWATITDQTVIVDTSGPYTIEALILVPSNTSVTSGSRYRIYLQGTGDGNSLAPDTMTFGMLESSGSLLLEFGTRDTSNRTIPGNIFDGEPHHLAVRCTSGGSVTLYLDGVAGSSTIVGFFPSAIAGAAIGGPNGGAGSGIGQGLPWPAVLGDVALYAADIGATRIAEHASAALAPWDGDTSGERIARILGFGWPSDLLDIATGFTVMGPAVLNKNQLQLIKGYEKAEGGRFFIARDGTATLLDRYFNQLVTEGATSQATFSDDGSDNRYCSIGFDYDDRQIYNRIRGSRPGGGDVEVFDQTSIDTYGEQVDAGLSGIEVGTDALVRGAVELRLDKYKDPQLRVRPIELKLHGMTAAQQADVLDLELGYRVTVERTPQGVGSAITQETVVEGISHRITGGQWTTTLTLSPVDTREYGLWGDNWGEALWGY